MVAPANFAHLRIVIFRAVKIRRCFQTVERVLCARYRKKPARLHLAGHHGWRNAAAGRFFFRKMTKIPKK